MEAIKSNANGSTFQEISKKNFRPLPVMMPTDVVIKAFDNLASQLYERIKNNEIENRTLASIRDTLLPKLISGELRVPDAERIVARMT